jgi:hypothetical protein
VGQWAHSAFQTPLLLSLSTLTRVLQGVLAVLGVVLVLLAITRYQQIGILDDLLDPSSDGFGGFMDIDSSVAANDTRLGLLTAVDALTRLVLIGVVMAWTYRAATNIARLGAQPPRHTMPLAVAGWIIPFANAWLPFQTMGSIWRGSEPARDEFGVKWWNRGRGSAVMSLWWGVLVFGHLVLFGAITGEPAQSTYWRDLESIRDESGTLLWSHLMLALGAVLGICVFEGCLRRMVARAQRYGATV